jgi:predicted porin
MVSFLSFQNYYLETPVKKFTLVATAVASLVSTSVMAQSTVTIYGIMDAAYVYTTKQVGGSKHAIDGGQLATSRWGIKGSEDLGNGMKANFGLESTIANDTGATGAAFGGVVVPPATTAATPTTTSMFDRQATVGLSGDFGSLNLGRQNNLAVDVVAVAEPSGFAHAGTNPNVLFSAMNFAAVYGAFGSNGGGTAFRENNSVKYLTPEFSGFSGGLMYAFGEQGGSTSKNSYAGILGKYASGPVAVALAYSKLKDVNDNSLTVWGGGAKFSLDAFTLKGTYAQTKDDAANRKIAITGLGLDYALSPAMTLTGAFYNTKQSGASDFKARQYLAIGKYALSKRTSIYSSFTHAKASATVITPATAPGDGALNAGLITPGNDTANHFAFGIMHSF